MATVVKHHWPLAAAEGPGCSRKFDWSLLGIFSLLLALVTARHVMWFDELQAWLIARDSNSLADLFHNLRYEGHPALWHLLLYVPAHIAWNPVSMQVINYLLAVTQAWLILSAHKLPWPIRALAIFSFFGFYRYGVYPRNYMLAMVLLTAATRCLLGERPHRKLAILFLALAINTHFFAIPIAAVLALQMFGLSKLKNRKDLGMLLRDSEFWTAFAVLFASVLVAYLTIRPPADLYTPHYDPQHHSKAYYLLFTESQTWQVLIPPNRITTRLFVWLTSYPHPVTWLAVFSLALFLIVAGALQTVQARFVFLFTSFLEVIAMGVITRRPGLQHLGMLFIVFLVALLIDAYTPPNRTSRPWLPKPVAFAVILAVLSLHALKTASASWSELSLPTSTAKATSSWLNRTGLSKNPLVMQGTDNSAALLGYMERPSAYYAACRCVGSFVVWRLGRDEYRFVTEEELENISRSSSLPVVVISGMKIPAETMQSLKLKELRDFRRTRWGGSFWVYQRLTVDP